MNEQNGSSGKVLFFKAFNKCQGSLDPVKADSQNDHFHNRYPSLAAVMDAVKPFMEAGFSFVSVGVVIGAKPFLRTSMIYGDYEISSDWPLVDDGNPQHLAASSTYAKRYNISGLTGLVIDSDDDGNTAAQVKTATREPASYVAKKEAEKAAITPSNEIEVVRFIPSKVVFVEGKGKGAGKTFGEIYDPKGVKYGGDELQGQMAQAACDNRQEIAVAFKRNGIYNNIGRGGVKMADAVPDTEDFHAIPF